MKKMGKVEKQSKRRRMERKVENKEYAKVSKFIIYWSKEKQTVKTDFR